MRLLRFARNDENSGVPYYVIHQLPCVILGLDPRISIGNFEIHFYGILDFSGVLGAAAPKLVPRTK